MQSWYVYIAIAKTQRLYTGMTSDPKGKLIEHNLGMGSKFAINQGPLKLLYISKSFLNKSEARKREIQIKNWSHSKKMKIVNGEWV